MTESGYGIYFRSCVVTDRESELWLTHYYWEPLVSKEDLGRGRSALSDMLDFLNCFLPFPLSIRCERVW